MPASIADFSRASIAKRKLPESKLVDMALRRVNHSVASALLLASLVVAALWPIIAHERLLAWLAAISCVMALHFFYVRRYMHLGHGADAEPGKWAAGFVVGSAAAGLCWGGAVFCFPSSPFNPVTIFGVFVLPSTPFDPVTVLLIFILAGVTAYGSVAMASVPSAAIVFVACAWLPLALWLFSFGEHMYVVMGLIALSFMGAMVMLARRMYDSICNLIAVSEENHGLRTTQQESDLRMARFFESAPGFFYTACMSSDGKSSMPFASARIRELFDVPVEDVADSITPLLARVHTDDIEPLNMASEASLRNLTPFHFECRINHPGRGDRWIELNSLPQREADGSTTWHGFMQDITERKCMEGALAAREQEFRSLAENLPVAVIRYDSGCRRRYLNRAAERMLHGNAAELLGNVPGGSSVPATPAMIEHYRGKMEEVLATGTARELDFVLDALPADRQEHYEVRFVPEYGADGKIAGVLAIWYDLTERKQMDVAREAALAEAQHLAQLRSAFMAQMSHELRTPLNGILGYTQLLLHGESLAEKQLAGLRIIHQSGEHLLSLINGLLDHAAIEADKFELILGDIELEPFLGSIIGIVRIRAEQKNISFACEAVGDLPAIVRGDAQRLRQVLLNLLANAIKFTDSGAVILRVSVTASDRIRFAVQDSGVGIAADQLENIFKPFEQIGEIGRRAGGTGLGLAISRKLVGLMGGDIQVESQPGTGSIFSFEIEMAVVQSGAAFNAAALSEQAATRVAQATLLLPAPSRSELDNLHSLALRGSMRDVMRHANQLAEADGRYLPFVEQLGQLARNFQTRALLGLIEQYLNERETA